MIRMPVNTALYINPADLMPKEEPGAARRRLFALRKPVKRVEAVAQITAPVVEERAPEPITAEIIPVDTSCITPRQFIRVKCGEHGFDYQRIIVKKSRKRNDVIDRDVLIKEVRQRYPALSLGRIGREFGLDHSSILTSLRRSGVPDGERGKIEIPRERIVALLNAGHPQHKVVAMIGCSQASVSTVARSIGHSKPSRTTNEKADQIKVLYDAGMSLSDIGLEVDFCASAIGRLVKRMRWTR